MEDIKYWTACLISGIAVYVIFRILISPITDRLDKIIKLLTKEDENVVGDKKQKDE